MGVRDLRVEDGLLRFTTTTNDPAIQSPPLKVRASHFSKLVVEMRVSRPGGAQLFWSTASEPFMTEVASLTLPAAADGQFHRYVFEVGKNGHWSGCVTGLRFDPATQTGVVVEIRSIRLE